VLYQIANHLGITQALGYNKNALLALWLIMARLIEQGSRLSAVRLAQNHAVAEILNLNVFNEDDLYKTLDWLYEHKEKIENQLFKESISRLAKITSNVIGVGEKRLVTVPRPDKGCKELLKRVNVTLPEVLPYRETHVATRKKLNSLRKRK